MKRFFLLSKFKQILVVVVSLHLCFVLGLCFHHFLTFKAPRKKIIVRSVNLPQKTMTASVKVEKPASKQGISPAHKPPLPAKPKNTLTPSKSSEKKAAPKAVAPTPSPKPVLKKKEADSILQEMEEGIRGLESSETLSSPLSSRAVLSLPSEIASAVSLEFLEEDLASYGELLIGYLQASLALPEVGDVKMDLKVDALGHLVSFDILEAKSKKNEEFLRKRLPELNLPCFNEPKNSQEIREFTIVFKNALPF